MQPHELNPKFRRPVEASVTIYAPLDLVRKVLVDFEDYPASNPFVVRVDAPEAWSPRRRCCSTCG